MNDAVSILENNLGIFIIPHSTLHKTNCNSTAALVSRNGNPKLAIGRIVELLPLPAVVVSAVSDDIVLCAMPYSLSQFIFIIPFHSKYNIAAKNTPTITVNIFAIFFKAYPSKNPTIPPNSTVLSNEVSIMILVISIILLLLL